MVGNSSPYREQVIFSKIWIKSGFDAAIASQNTMNRSLMLDTSTFSAIFHYIFTALSYHFKKWKTSTKKKKNKVQSKKNAINRDKISLEMLKSNVM